MNTVSVETYKERILAAADANEVVCVDVRSLAEYEREHIKGVLNIPLSELHTHGHIFKNASEVYVQCQSGGRSSLAVVQLSRMYPSTTFFDVHGGLIAWKQAGFETIRKV